MDPLNNAETRKQRMGQAIGGPGVRARLANWFDQRTGWRRLVDALLLEHIPGGAKWRYVWGSCLAFVFTVQLVTGILLMTSYSPGDSTAWSSVYFIQYQMDFGWLIRGLHHFGSQAMVVLLGVHMLQVVIAGAQLPPREVNWWLGLGLLAAILGLSLTGYLLPWDQKGYWATQVATNIAGNLPGLGPAVQKIVVGGPVYGHQTLTRFYALHVGILPPLVIVLIIAHLVVFRRHGVTTPKKTVGEGWFWPDQAFRDMVVSMVTFAVLLGLVLYGHGHPQHPPGTSAETGAEATAESPGLYERLAHAGRYGLGANLDAPADPARPYPARPEWYFLFLFQLLKYFEGEQEIIGTVVIPNAVLVLLFILPLLGYGWMRPVGRVVGVLVVGGVIVGAGALTYLAMAADRAPRLSAEEIAKLQGTERQQVEKAMLFHEQLAAADQLAQRAIDLAGEGIPPEGAIDLLRRDPLTRGPDLFRQNCAVCHTYGTEMQSDRASASDLAGFGTKEWISDLLRQPENPHFFGRTKLRTMANWVQRTRDAARKKGKEADLDAEFATIATWLAGHPNGSKPAEGDSSEFARGYRAFENRCGRCHSYGGSGGGDSGAPDFTGYGDEDWVRVMVMAPAHPLRYGNRNAMPAFRDLEGPGAEVTRLELARIKDLQGEAISGDDADAKKQKQALDQATRVVNLSDVDRELIIRWLVGNGRVVFGGQPISGPPSR
jgi:ubiquinol-cytochrome c reductase cytochrome b subunit